MPNFEHNIYLDWLGFAKENRSYWSYCLTTGKQRQPVSQRTRQHWLLCGYTE